MVVLFRVVAAAVRLRWMKPWTSSMPTPCAFCFCATTLTSASLSMTKSRGRDDETNPAYAARLVPCTFAHVHQ
jgi:hypothetical protein